VVKRSGFDIEGGNDGDWSAGWFRQPCPPGPAALAHQLAQPCHPGVALDGEGVEQGEGHVVGGIADVGLTGGECLLGPTLDHRPCMAMATAVMVATGSGLADVAVGAVGGLAAGYMAGEIIDEVFEDDEEEAED
jgi:hypothetical protein